MQMVMASDETQIQIPADWSVSCKMRDKGQLEKSRISCRRDKETEEGTNTVLEKIHGQTISKMSSISDLKGPTAPKNTYTEQSKNIDAKTANENSAGLRGQHFRLRSFASLYLDCSVYV